MLGFFHRKKGSSSTHKAPVQPRKAPVKSTVSSAAQTTPVDVDQCCVEQSDEFLCGSVIANEIILLQFLGRAVNRLVHWRINLRDKWVM